MSHGPADLWKIAKHEYVEMEIPAGSTNVRFSLPDLKNLRKVHLRGLAFYTADNFPNGVNNDPVLTTATLSQAWLTLQLYNGKEFVHQIPLQQFFQTGGITNFNLQNFLFQKVNWPKSYIEFSVGPVPAANSIIPFSVFYHDRLAVEINDGTYGFRKKA